MTSEDLLRAQCADLSRQLAEAKRVIHDSVIFLRGDAMFTALGTLQTYLDAHPMPKEGTPSECQRCGDGNTLLNAYRLKSGSTEWLCNNCAEENKGELELKEGM